MRMVRLALVVACIAPLGWLACTGDTTIPSGPDASAQDSGNDATLKDSGPDVTADATADTGPDDAALDAGAKKFGCDPSSCNLGQEACCYTGLNQGTCQPIGDGSAFCNKGTASQFNCGRTSDCANGQVCCATDSQLSLADAAAGFFGRCTSTCTGTVLVTAYTLCNGPNDTTTCVAADGGAKTCSPVVTTTKFPPSFYYCK
jgi:hypothetical protein